MFVARNSERASWVDAINRALYNNNTKGAPFFYNGIMKEALRARHHVP
jgi:hypothetical protein